jgi:hypothetical protein
VPGPDPLLLVFSLPGWAPVPAYGPSPGMEFIPYFLALLAWVGVALAGVLLWPISVLLRRLRRTRGVDPPGPKGESTRDDQR